MAETELAKQLDRIGTYPTFVGAWLAPRTSVALGFEVFIERLMIRRATWIGGQL
jgi:hypothetical protein